jgi:transcriptional regulator with GAF, ATPase, and Fis domain
MAAQLASSLPAPFCEALPYEGRYGIVGRSGRTTAVCRLIERAARTPFPVLLQGESGTGKEVAARAVHRASDRASRQFIVVDCGSLVGSLVESELFGHVKGAFSGAFAAKKGLVEIADGGTAFFDEIGDLPLDMQVKLLRLIQEGECRPVGALYPRTVDLRIIAATNRDLAKDVADGRFRQDLYYRLNVLPIYMPPLRERKEDIPLLVAHFLHELAEMGLPSIQATPEMLETLRAHSWPGNVRELKHWVERMVALQTNNGALELQGFQIPDPPRPVVVGLAGGAGRQEAASDSQPTLSLRDGELRLISAALAAADGNRARAAELLGVSRTTLYRRIKEYGADLHVCERPSASDRTESTITGLGVNL